MVYNKLKQTLAEYNWDDGFDLPEKLLADPNCDLALALEIFYLADGCAYLSEPERDTPLKAWKSFVERLYNDISEGKYPHTDSAFTIPLNRVQRFKLKKSGVPDVFLTDL